MECSCQDYVFKLAKKPGLRGVRQTSTSVRRFFRLLVPQGYQAQQFRVLDSSAAPGYLHQVHGENFGTHIHEIAREVAKPKSKVTLLHGFNLSK